MALDLDIFKAIAPEYKDVSSTTLDVLTPVAERRVNVSYFGNKAPEAIAYLVAHMIKISERNGNGAITSEKVGDLSRSYAVNSTNILGSTAYGEEFLAIRRTVSTSPLVC